jgi:hypothetical protein
LIEDNYEEAYSIFLGIKWWDYWEMLSIHHFYPDLLDKVRQDERFKHILYILNKNWGMRPAVEPETDQRQVLSKNKNFYK